MTYGMDCSGLVYNIATATGISSPKGNAFTQGNPDNWTIPTEWSLQMKQVTDGTIETGDVVGWDDHIGIAESSGTATMVNVISSTERPGQCDKNIKPPRGPRSLAIGTLKTTPPKSILRLTTGCPCNRDIYRTALVGTTWSGTYQGTLANGGAAVSGVWTLQIQSQYWVPGAAPGGLSLWQWTGTLSWTGSCGGSGPTPIPVNFTMTIDGTTLSAGACCDAVTGTQSVCIQGDHFVLPLSPSTCLPLPSPGVGSYYSICGSSGSITCTRSG